MCPNCGYCPHCGRSGQHVAPFMPTNIPNTVPMIPTRTIPVTWTWSPLPGAAPMPTFTIYNT